MASTAVTRIKQVVESTVSLGTCHKYVPLFGTPAATTNQLPPSSGEKSTKIGAGAKATSAALQVSTICSPPCRTAPATGAVTATSGGALSTTSGWLTSADSFPARS